MSKEAATRRSIQRFQKGIKAMPEERKTFMQELDEWTHKFIVERLHGAWQEYLESGDPTTHRMLNEAIAEVKQSIREKVLESYRNGQKAGPSRPQNKQQK